jgi:hypothetical protein
MDIKKTLRISSLLKSYTDGLAVFKELIQNADDAGATKVCFLYDERDNLDCRDGLFDKGMIECQLLNVSYHDGHKKLHPHCHLHLHLLINSSYLPCCNFALLHKYIA